VFTRTGKLFSLDKIGGFFPLIDLDHTEEAFPGSSSETPYPNHAVNRLEKEIVK
jgi:hypothetical protein